MKVSVNFAKVCTHGSFIASSRGFCFVSCALYRKKKKNLTGIHSFRTSVLTGCEVDCSLAVSVRVILIYTRTLLTTIFLPDVCLCINH